MTKEEKGMKKLAMCVLLSLAVLFGLTSCGDSADDMTAVDLAIIVGCHNNAPTPALQSSTVQESIQKSTASYGSVCVIVNDGSPFVAADYEVSAPTANLSGAKRKEIAQAQAAQITAVMTESRAETPEVDTLAAITLAARALEGAEGERFMVVMDSGLSTTGYVDFTDNLLYAEPKAVIDYLERTKALPDLNGIEVVWVGLGDVAGDQDQLTPSNLEGLKELWFAILDCAGAESVNFASDLPNGTPQAQNLPYVTPVEILEEAAFDMGELDFSVPVVFHEDKILFLPDSAQLADQEAAGDILLPIADYMTAHPEFELLVAGTTATAGSNEDCKVLSEARAEVVAEALTALGVDRAQIAGTVGLGYEHPYHIPDIGEDGSQNENAPKNRSVILFDADTPEARQLMGK